MVLAVPPLKTQSSPELPTVVDTAVVPECTVTDPPAAVTSLKVLATKSHFASGSRITLPPFSRMLTPEPPPDIVSLAPELTVTSLAVPPLVTVMVSLALSTPVETAPSFTI